MDKSQIIQKTEGFVKEKLSGEGSGHDWWHVYRVWELAKHIAKEEQGADLFIVELTALLHDIADWKFHGGDDLAGPRVAREWLEKSGVKEKDIQHVCKIVEHISFKGAGVESKIQTLEGKIVQDADRLDAIGAVGIARAFAYGGYKRQEIYNPEIKILLHQTAESYKNSKTTTINHFYEKLLLLKDKMNTDTGKEIASERHKFMEEYLERFYKEWKGQL